MSPALHCHLEANLCWRKVEGRKATDDLSPGLLGLLPRHAPPPALQGASLHPYFPSSGPSSPPLLLAGGCTFCPRRTIGQVAWQQPTSCFLMTDLTPSHPSPSLLLG